MKEERKEERKKYRAHLHHRAFCLEGSSSTQASSHSFNIYQFKCQFPREAFADHPIIPSSP